jgi:curved DNA-binding protein CbpA
VATHYDVLGIPRGATQAEIKKSYKIGALKWHPDKNNNDPVAADRFKAIGGAYEILSDVEDRAEYDRTLPREVREESAQQKQLDEARESSDFIRIFQSAPRGEEFEWGSAILEKSNAVLSKDDDFRDVLLVIADNPPLDHHWEAQQEILRYASRFKNKYKLSEIQDSLAMRPPRGREEEAQRARLAEAADKSHSHVSAYQPGRVLAAIAQRPPPGKEAEFRRLIFDAIDKFDELFETYSDEHKRESIDTNTSFALSGLAKAPLPGKEWESQVEILDRCSILEDNSSAFVFNTLAQNPPPGRVREFTDVLFDVIDERLPETWQRFNALKGFADIPPRYRSLGVQEKVIEFANAPKVNSFQISKILGNLAKQPKPGHELAWQNNILNASSQAGDGDDEIRVLGSLAENLPPGCEWEFAQDVIKKTRDTFQSKNVPKKNRARHFYPSRPFTAIIENPPLTKEWESQQLILENVDVLDADSLCDVLLELANHPLSMHKNELKKGILKAAVRVPIGEDHKELHAALSQNFRDEDMEVSDHSTEERGTAGRPIPQTQNVEAIIQETQERKDVPPVFQTGSRQVPSDRSAPSLSSSSPKQRLGTEFESHVSDQSRTRISYQTPKRGILKQTHRPQSLEEKRTEAATALANDRTLHQIQETRDRTDQHQDAARTSRAVPRDELPAQNTAVQRGGTAQDVVPPTTSGARTPALLPARTRITISTPSRFEDATVRDDTLIANASLDNRDDNTLRTGNQRAQRRAPDERLKTSRPRNSLREQSVGTAPESIVFEQSQASIASQVSQRSRERDETSRQPQPYTSPTTRSDSPKENIALNRSATNRLGIQEQTHRAKSQENQRRKAKRYFSEEGSKKPLRDRPLPPLPRQLLTEQSTGARGDSIASQVPLRTQERDSQNLLAVYGKAVATQYRDLVRWQNSSDPSDEERLTLSEQRSAHLRKSVPKDIKDQAWNKAATPEEARAAVFAAVDACNRDRTFGNQGALGLALVAASLRQRINLEDEPALAHAFAPPDIRGASSLEAPPHPPLPARSPHRRAFQQVPTPSDDVHGRSRKKTEPDWRAKALSMYPAEWRADLSKDGDALAKGLHYLPNRNIWRELANAPLSGHPQIIAHARELVDQPSRNPMSTVPGPSTRQQRRAQSEQKGHAAHLPTSRVKMDQEGYNMPQLDQRERATQQHGNRLQTRETPPNKDRRNVDRLSRRDTNKRKAPGCASGLLAVLKKAGKVLAKEIGILEELRQLKGR